MQSPTENKFSFTITSGNICFGGLHNVWHGTEGPRQTALPQWRQSTSGTVSIHQIEYNLPARMGTWNGIPLRRISEPAITAWFVSHSDVNPTTEIERFMEVAGSPYESYSGSRWNTDETSDKGVLLVNRYDWDWYDKRSWGAVYGDDNDQPTFANGVGCALVDLSHARQYVEQWKTQLPEERQSSSDGAWLWLQGHEYLFGRFGFDDGNKAARSFLFFSSYTDFEQTTLDGDNPLRGTPHELFLRALEKGIDFSGIWLMKELPEPGEDEPWMQCAAPQDELLGPFDASEYILTKDDIDVLRRYRGERKSPLIIRGRDVNTIEWNRPRLEFIDPWTEPTFELINEVLLSYMTHAVIPIIGQQNLGEVLFPHHLQDPSVDRFCYRYLNDWEADLITDLDVIEVAARIRAFLESRTRVDLEDSCIFGLARVSAYFIREFLVLAENSARDARRNNILPLDIRISIRNDVDVWNKLKYSRVLMQGLRER